MAVALLSGAYSIYGLMDMFFRVGLTSPIDILESQGKYLPQYGGFKGVVLGVRFEHPYRIQ